MCNLVSKCQYVHEHARFLRSAIFIFSPGKADNPGCLLALTGIYFYANFFSKLAIKSIKSNPSKSCCYKRKAHLGWFIPLFFGIISLKEYKCSDGYQYILGQLITKIIHAWWLSVRHCQYKLTAVYAPLTFHRWAKLFKAKLKDKFPFQFFKSSKNFPFPLKFWQNYLIDWAEKGASWWTAAKKVNLISSDCNHQQWQPFSKHTLQPCSSPTRYVRYVRVCCGIGWT